MGFNHKEWTKPIWIPARKLKRRRWIQRTQRVCLFLLSRISFSFSGEAKHIVASSFLFVLLINCLAPSRRFHGNAPSSSSHLCEKKKTWKISSFPHWRRSLVRLWSRFGHLKRIRAFLSLIRVLRIARSSHALSFLLVLW